MNKMKFSKIGKYLPGFSFLDYAQRISPDIGEGNQDEMAKPEPVQFEKLLGHMLYGSLFFGLVLSYSLSVIVTGRLNPLEQIGVVKKLERNLQENDKKKSGLSDLEKVLKYNEDIKKNFIN